MPFKKEGMHWTMGKKGGQALLASLAAESDGEGASAADATGSEWTCVRCAFVNTHSGDRCRNPCTAQGTPCGQVDQAR